MDDDHKKPAKGADYAYRVRTPTSARAGHTDAGPRTPANSTTGRRAGPLPSALTRTAVATPTDDEETVLIANKTDKEWTLHLDYHALDTVASRAEWEIRVAKWQMFTAHQVTAPLGAEYLTADLTPAIRCVEIRYDAHHGQLAY